MFCSHCGNQIPDDAKFCPVCGDSVNAAEKTAEENNPQEVNSNLKPQSDEGKGSQDVNEKPLKKKRGKKVLVILGIAVGLVIIAAAVIMLLPDSTDAAINTVKSGYLGCYTDVTVEDIINYTFSYATGAKSGDIVWDGGEADDGTTIVEASYTDNDHQKSAIQFKMLTDDTFKFSALSGPSSNVSYKINGLDDVITTLNGMYLAYYMDHDGEEAATEKLNKYSVGAVLCGASANFSGDRENLYQNAFQIDKLDVTAANYMGLLDAKAN